MSVVVGYIATPEGRAALQTAVKESQLRQTTLVVVNSRDTSKDSAQETAANERELQDISRQLESDGVNHEIRTLARGTLPSEDINEIAEETGAELIVIGLRRRSPMGKIFLGSNAQEILFSAECPVLSVRAPQ